VRPGGGQNSAVGRHGRLSALAVGASLVLAACGAASSSPVAAPPVLPAEEPARAAPTTAVTTVPATTAPLVRPASVTLPVPSTAPPTTPAPPTTAAPVTPAPTAPPPPATNPPPPPAPVPPPPANAREPVAVIGSIEIPKLGVSERLLSGITMPTLDLGPGYWPGTALPGQAGNTVIAGHRTSKSRPFRYIDRLVEGDEIVITANDVRYTYRVTGHEIVTPDAVWILNQDTAQPTVTLFACHPPGSVAYRWVTRAVLVG
jgi:sortase A